MQNLLSRFVPMATLLSRLASGSLTEKFIFIEPTYDAKNDFRNGNSMHPAGDVRKGEALVKQVYDAISTSALWPSSVLLVVFDEHGGFFDHVTPPIADLPDSAENARLKTHNFSFDRMGVRVPAIVVSPFVPAGTIDHSVYDHTSILKTTDKLLGLDGLLHLTARVRAANDFTKMLSLSTPRAEILVCPSPVTIAGGSRHRQARALRARRTHSCRCTHTTEAAFGRRPLSPILRCDAERSRRPSRSASFRTRREILSMAMTRGLISHFAE
ncbi:phosphoesterase [Caballeronia arvi]|uniref:Phosphoesterase n=1 Tax=Caballeronia arvi TaxID=1777135 RepID=A0A158KZJ0_9BURK|nr:alkaline phosphatase family protein [Caballeronia arvi]SAL86169.1 phosphoesterase [Caballeronia arvi]